MLIEFHLSHTIIMLIGIMLIIFSSILVPLYGYSRKHWKGLALGCLLQPLICGILIVILIASVTGFSIFSINQERKAAMVTVRTTQEGACGTDTLMWYLKPNEECLVEYRNHVKKASEGADSVDVDVTGDRYDIIRLDTLSHAVSVEDRLTVRFDLSRQKATATDYDKPAEVVSVDWDKVRAYFPEDSQKKKKR